MLKTGWATRDFTPDRPALVRGQMNTRIGRKAIDPLTLTACAVENEGCDEQAIIISCDLAAIDDALLVAVRKRLSSMLPELSPDKLILCATHTHTSLVLIDGQYPHPGGDVMTSDECLALVAKCAAEAAAEAWEKRAPCLVQRAFGHAVVQRGRAGWRPGSP